MRENEPRRVFNLEVWKFGGSAGGLQRGLETFCREGASGQRLMWCLYRYRLKLVRSKPKVSSPLGDRCSKARLVVAFCKEVWRPLYIIITGQAFAWRVLQGSVCIRGRNFVFFVTSPFRVGAKRNKKSKMGK